MYYMCVYPHVCIFIFIWHTIFESLLTGHSRVNLKFIKYFSCGPKGQFHQPGYYLFGAPCSG